MGIGGKAADIVDGVGGRLACAILRASDVDGICAVADGLDADVGCAGGCKKFE